VIYLLKTEIPKRSYSGERWITNKTNKKYLAIDFKHRCAYCDDLDSIYGGPRLYDVEHFAPKEKFPALEFTYDNLLYACTYCNNSKNDDWPSGNSTISVVGDCGYVDPCTDAYYDHLDRDERTGKIYSKSDLGKYMYDHLKLYLRRHEIIYMLDKLQMKINQLTESIKTDNEAGVDTSKKEAFLSAYKNEFYDYYCQIQKQPGA
jgi:hypothetical protein